MTQKYTNDNYTREKYFRDEFIIVLLYSRIKAKNFYFRVIKIMSMMSSRLIETPHCIEFDIFTYERVFRGGCAPPFSDRDATLNVACIFRAGRYRPDRGRYDGRVFPDLRIH